MVRRSVDDVLPKDAVANVQARERIVRLLVDEIERVAAFTIVALGLVGSGIIMVFSAGLRAGAFQMFNAIVSGALGYFFATRARK